MSAVTVPSLCDDMLGRVQTHRQHATKVVPASIVRIHCRLHDVDEVGLQLPEELVNAFTRLQQRSAQKQKTREVLRLVFIGELLAIGVLALASAAFAAAS